MSREHDIIDAIYKIQRDFRIPHWVPTVKQLQTLQKEIYPDAIKIAQILGIYLEFSIGPTYPHILAGKLHRLSIVCKSISVETLEEIVQILEIEDVHIQ